MDGPKCCCQPNFPGRRRCTGQCCLRLSPAHQSRMTSSHTNRTTSRSCTTMGPCLCLGPWAAAGESRARASGELWRPRWAAWWPRRWTSARGGPAMGAGRPGPYPCLCPCRQTYLCPFPCCPCRCSSSPCRSPCPSLKSPNLPGPSRPCPCPSRGRASEPGRPLVSADRLSSAGRTRPPARATSPSPTQQISASRPSASSRRRRRRCFAASPTLQCSCFPGASRLATSPGWGTSGRAPGRHRFLRMPSSSPGNHPQ
mmetsp:Transcript_5568/g.13746  ORF Transcript_5568/g.13746 Transcript_5568/m.13746 type:complete len:256 (-) Transcript_5568:772-1539(-)